jgi:hypothetical protein
LKKLLLIVSFIVFTTHLEAQTTGKSSLTSVNTPVLKFYPNPATTVINFDFQKSYEKGYTLEIYNFLGRKMFNGQNVSEKTTVNLADFTRGVYIYQLRDKNGRLVESGKFQVSK